MMLRKCLKTSLLLVMYFSFILAARAESPLPQPPAQNPHPPQSAEDRRRVDFAVQEIKTQYGPKVTIVHPHIVPWTFEKFINNTRPLTPSTSQPPPAPMPESKAPPGGSMSGLILKPDEYVVHAYVKFPNDAKWYNLRVFISEDLSGKLSRRRFSSTPMENPSQVDC
ncbi:MAG TPA: hypothetical protein DF383_02485 [Deltaproteobacteria bacterium]|nr:hypothetical protein [Deltaproteobacteria bacterium]